MARYTVELRELVESGVNLGLDKYPIWDENHREELNTKIIDHYKYREIGFETVGRFVDELNIKMNEIMPYYIKLYETTLYEYNPIHNVDYTEENTTKRDSTGSSESNSNVENKEVGTSKGTGTVTGESSSESSSESNNKHSNVEIDTPQSNINVSDLKNLDSAYPYASKITTDENNDTTNQSNSGTAHSNDTSTTETESRLTTDYNSSSNSSNNTEQNETETFTKHLLGNYGVTTSQNMIKQEREIIINIDMQIIGQLRNLFMQVF